MPRKPPAGKRFEKGKSGNPLGAAAHNQELKKIRRMTHTDVAEVGQMIVMSNLENLNDVTRDPNSSVLKVWMSSVAATAIKRGDAGALGVLLDRIVGKPKERISLESPDGGPVQVEAKVIITNLMKDPEAASALRVLALKAESDET